MAVCRIRHEVDLDEDVGFVDIRAHRRQVDELGPLPSPGSTVTPLRFQSSGMPSPVDEASSKIQLT